MTKPTIQEQLKKKILILDGAMGTMIQQENLTAEDFGSDDLDGCNEMLVLTRPDVIRKIHEAYFEAGADIIETNTFGATSVVLAEYDLQDRIARSILLQLSWPSMLRINIRHQNGRVMLPEPWGRRPKRCP